VQRKEQGPLISLLPRQPGEKEARYAHTLSGVTAAQMTPRREASALSGSAENVDRIGRLETEIAELRVQLDSVLDRLAKLEGKDEPVAND
jgi:uncharacterized protein